MTDRDLLKMALEALEHIQRSIGMGTATIHFGSSTWEQSDAAINVLRARLARPEPYDQTALELCDKCGWKALIPGDGCLNCARMHPPRHEWQGLPDDEISRLRHLIDPTAGWSYIAFARAINDALREKNT